MASNPKKLLQKIFATNRRILVNQSISSIQIDKSWRKILVVGAGNDPYRDLFDDLAVYVRLDIVVKKEIVDVVADAHNLPFDSDTFDCIMAIEVFEHLEKPDLFIDEAYRVLKSSKSIFLSIPFMFHEHGDPYDFSRPTKFTLEKYCKNFSKLEIHPQGSRIHVILDIISTTKSLFGLFRFLRIFNHFVCLFKFKTKTKTTAPSGYFIKATK